MPPTTAQGVKAAPEFLAVPGDQVRIADDLLPVGVPGGRLDPAGGYGGALGEQREPEHGPVHAAGQAADRQDHLARLGEPRQLQIQARPDLLLPEHGLQIDRPPLGGTAEHHGVARPDVLGQVVGGGVQTVAEEGQLPAGEGEHLPGGQRIAGPGEGIQIQHGPVLQPLPQGIHPQPELRQHTGKLTVLQQALRVLLLLPEEIFRPVHHPGAF